MSNKEEKQGERDSKEDEEEDTLPEGFKSLFVHFAKGRLFGNSYSVLLNYFLIVVLLVVIMLWLSARSKETNPCGQGFLLVDGKCLKLDLHDCVLDEDCMSGSCHRARCLPSSGFPNGYRCQDSSVCRSKLCVLIAGNEVCTACSSVETCPQGEKCDVGVCMLVGSLKNDLLPCNTHEECRSKDCRLNHCKPVDGFPEFWGCRTDLDCENILGLKCVSSLVYGDEILKGKQTGKICGRRGDPPVKKPPKKPKREKLDDFESCSYNNQCLNGRCVARVCMPKGGFPVGYRCQRNSHCRSQKCRIRKGEKLCVRVKDFETCKDDDCCQSRSCVLGKCMPQGGFPDKYPCNSFSHCVSRSCIKYRAAKGLGKGLCGLLKDLVDCSEPGERCQSGRCEMSICLPLEGLKDGYGCEKQSHCFHGCLPKSFVSSQQPKKSIPNMCGVLQEDVEVLSKPGDYKSFNISSVVSFFQEVESGGRKLALKPSFLWKRKFGVSKNFPVFVYVLSVYHCGQLNQLRDKVIRTLQSLDPPPESEILLLIGRQSGKEDCSLPSGSSSFCEFHEGFFPKLKDGIESAENVKILGMTEIPFFRKVLQKPMKVPEPCRKLIKSRESFVKMFNVVFERMLSQEQLPQDFVEEQRRVLRQKKKDE